MQLNNPDGAKWFWPGHSDLNDFPDPLGIEEKWVPWQGTMQDGPSVYAEIFAREYIQNSWDSIRSKSYDLLSGQDPRDASIAFKFVELPAQEASRFLASFGLTDHSSRLKSMTEAERENNRVGEQTVLDAGGGSPLRLLIAEERLGEGMSGSWEHGDNSDYAMPRMRIALIQSTTGKVGETTGGSWGQGKKAVAAASGCRTLAVYSCHGTDDHEDPSTTRRFMGVTYWRVHETGGTRHAGLGLLGKALGDDAKFADFRPLENEDADRLVSQLQVPGLDLRDPENQLDHGTSYLFVEPTFSPEELASAIERNWWPLLESHKVNIEVHNYQGEVIDISPGTRHELKPFIKAHGLLLGKHPVDAASDLRQEVKFNGLNAGTVGATSDTGDFGWSYEVPEGSTNTDLVALIRNDMVIAYQQCPMRRPRSNPPFIRGAFVVSDDETANKNLKLSEGHLHNSWREDSQHVGKEVASFARTVNKAINDRVLELRKRVRPPEDANTYRLRAFEEIFAGKGPSVGSTKPKAKKPTSNRPVFIRGASKTARELDPNDPTQLRFTTTVQLGIPENSKLDEMEVVVDLGWKVLEETTPQRDPALTDKSTINHPLGFKWEEDKLTGTLTREAQSFEWSSAYFPDDWQVTPDPLVAQLQPTAEAGL